MLFQLLYAHVGLGAVTAKCLATLVSMTVAYFAHRFWSFSHRARTGLRREYLLFAVVNGATLLLNVGVVAFVRYPLGQESALVLQVANIAGIAAGPPSGTSATGAGSSPPRRRPDRRQFLVVTS